ncbi:MAG: hypothetical protein ACHQK8_09150 [Bacteroidia bacterium]
MKRSILLVATCMLFWQTGKSNYFDISANGVLVVVLEKIQIT